MELLSPAGSTEKLAYAYRYGADAAYMGVQGFSLRANAESARPVDFEELRRIKGDRKLYGALNLYAHDHDLDRLREYFDHHENFPFDAWIVSDLGVYAVLRKYRPHDEVHLSTQANCLNAEAARLYRDLGFSRIIPGRELSLRDIARMKHEVPDLQIEAFVHGAMCMALSGRCFLSAEMTGRSANRGDCAHTCRWSFRAMSKALEEGEVVLEEKERPGEYFPIIESGGYTAILSSRDLNMVRHLRDLRDAGVDALKIEGRMKSLYYVAVVTRAYRKALEHLEGRLGDAELEEYLVELERVSHRDFSTGFFYEEHEMDKATTRSYDSTHRFLGTLGPRTETPEVLRRSLGDGTWHTYPVHLLNTLRSDMPLEFVSSQFPWIPAGRFFLSSPAGELQDRAVHQKPAFLHVQLELEEGTILRVAANGVL